MAANHGTVGHLLPQSYKRMVAEWLEEDCPSFDYGGFVVGEAPGEARLLGKSKVINDICSPSVLLPVAFIALVDLPLENVIRGHAI
jgi:hypothetical protein